MKKVDRGAVRDTAIPTHPNLTSKKANLKTDTEIMTRPSVRFGHQSEVMEQNRLLVGVNEDLQKKISELKETVSGLEQRCSDLQENNTDIRKQLSDCHVLLIAENLDPGERICKEAEQKKGQRRELMTISQKLLTELKSFDDFTKEHQTQLTEVQNTMRNLRGASEKLHLERESFSVYAENMEKALEEAERLLTE
ncbi:hypothetical protein Baya_1147 [Bagarius yarrelli]|uniref:Small kinetochore-associated protein n=1 Tax=Bagarius yarrelli TaxID=175774 RepID=A0A556TKA4_BAGYA|nr:hypothetical protein Baya_1147 [Bagarius yarrelli]